MCGSMVDIQSAAAEIRRGIKKDRKKLQGKNIMSASATQGGHNKLKGHSVISTGIIQHATHDLLLVFHDNCICLHLVLLSRHHKIWKFSPSDVLVQAWTKLNFLTIFTDRKLEWRSYWIVYCTTCIFSSFDIIHDCDGYINIQTENSLQWLSLNVHQY